MTLIALNTSKEQQVRDGPRKDRAGGEGRADLFVCVFWDERSKTGSFKKNMNLRRIEVGNMQYRI